MRWNYEPWAAVALSMTACWSSEEIMYTGEPALTAAEISHVGTAVIDGHDATMALPRVYGAQSLKFVPCMHLADVRRVVGSDCRSGIVAFGPYIDVPSDSEVSIVFEVHAKKRVSVWSDVTSETGRQTHGALLEQVIHAGERRWFGHQLHFFEGVSGVETRIFVRGNQVADFELNDFAISVRPHGASNRTSASE